MFQLDLILREPNRTTLPKVLREIADTMEERSNQLSEDRTEDDGASRYWKVTDVEEDDE